MKIALLNDTHFGARNDSLIFDDFFHKFYNEIFFPYLKEHNIKTLIHLGDVVDRRKFINFRIAHNFRHKFLQRLWDEKIDTHILIGNHDIYFRNTNKVNAIKELCTTSDGVNEPWIYEEAKVTNFGDIDILMVPWINPENEAETLELLKTAEADICIGHFDLNNSNLKIIGGIMEDKTLSKEEVANIATLPTLVEARSKIAAILKIPAQKIMSILLAPGSKIAILALAKSKKT